MSLGWMDNALCAQVDTELFFPNAYFTGRKAKSICQRCEAIDECLEYAMQTRVLGVWGGTTDADRAKLRRMKGATNA